MKDKGRLLKLLEPVEGASLEAIADRLLEGGVIVPPVKEGQSVWYADDFTETIEECRVYGFSVANGKLSLFLDNGECKFVADRWHNTKNGAEQALKIRRKDFS